MAVPIQCSLPTVSYCILRTHRAFQFPSLPSQSPLLYSARTTPLFSILLFRSFYSYANINHCPPPISLLNPLLLGPNTPSHLALSSQRLTSHFSVAHISRLASSPPFSPSSSHPPHLDFLISPTSPSCCDLSSLLTPSSSSHLPHAFSLSSHHMILLRAPSYLSNFIPSPSLYNSPILLPLLAFQHFPPPHSQHPSSPPPLPPFLALMDPAF